MQFQPTLSIFLQDRRIGACLGIGELHRPPEEIERLQRLQRQFGGIDGLVDYEGLAARFHVLFGHDLDDMAEFVEDFVEG